MAKFEEMFDYKKKEAAKIAAKKIKDAGFKVYGSGFGGVTVSYSNKTLIILAEDADEFIKNPSEF